MSLVYLKKKKNGEVEAIPWNGDLDKLPVDKDNNYAPTTSTECIEECARILKESRGKKVLKAKNP